MPVLLLVVGIATLAFPFTLFFDRSEEASVTTVGLQVIGFIVVSAGIVFIYRELGQRSIKVSIVRFPIALAAVVVGVAAAAFPYSQWFANPAPWESPTRVVVKFYSPAPNSRIFANKDFEVAGTVSVLQKDESLWLFAGSGNDPSKKFYFSSFKPVAESNGRWSKMGFFKATTVGRKTYLAVHANADCNKELMAAVGQESSCIIQFPTSGQTVAELAVSWVE